MSAQQPAVVTAGPGPFVPDEPQDLAARLAATAQRRPDHVALRWLDQTLTYRELDQRVDRGVTALQGLGVEPGDRVGLVVGNVPGFVEGWYATLRAGAVAVPLSPALAPDELRHVLDHAGVAVVLVGASVLEHVTEAAVGVSTDPTVVVVGAASDAPAGLPRWTDLVEAADPDGARQVARAADDLAAISYTSGTTGRPRGVRLTHGNLAANQDQSLAGRFRIEADDVVLLVLPLSHIYALNVGLGSSVHRGATMVLQERFDPTGTMEAVEANEVSILLGVPAMFAAWIALDTPAAAFSSVRMAVSGAAALPPRVFEGFMQQHGIAIEEGYGLTEAGPSVASNAMAELPHAGSVGLPLPGIELRVIDDDGQDVTPGDPGELLVRGPNVFVGYERDDEATAEVLDADGWLHTGDVAQIDGAGLVHLVDRKKDLVIVSGFNVYPREVERVLRAHDAVRDCAVVGVAHPYTGEAVKAFVVPARADVGADELTAHCRERLARYKCPEIIELVDMLPTTITGKVRRSALREA